MKTKRLDTILSTLSDLTDDLSASLPVESVRRFFSVPDGASPFSWPALRIGDLIAKTPIVQGGMGVGISLSRLASAVAEEGGVGVVAANGIGLLEKDYYADGRAANLRALRREIRTAREKSDGIIGVNIMVALNDFHELLDVAIEERADIVFMGAGLPIKGIPVDRMREAGVKAAPIVSSVRATEMIFRMWKKIYNDVPDAVVYEGPLAGGHLGFSPDQLDDPEVQLETVVPDIAEALVAWEREFSRSIPVIAGGGVYSGADIQRVLSLGASAVQMGTRFVATEECDADVAFKQAYVHSTEADIGLIHSPVGMPGRAIRNDFIRSVEAGTRPAFRCAWQCLASCKADDAKYCISIALNNARRGKLDHGFVFAGANAHRVDEIVRVPDLVGELATEFREAARKQLAHRLQPIVTGIDASRRQYATMQKQVRELHAAYEAALEKRIRSMQDMGVEGIYERYEALRSSARGIQHRITVGLTDAWALVRTSAGRGDSGEFSPA